MKNEHEIGRYEFKYVVPARWRDQILEFIRPHVRPDPHAGPLPGSRIGYLVHSLYFDTPELTDYHERLAQRRVRNRLRIRTYGQAGEGQPIFLENKRKSGRWTIKHRVRAGDADTWLQEGTTRPWRRPCPEARGRARFAAHSFDTLVNGSRRDPVTVVHYQREVFVPRSRDLHHVRLTLDHEVRANSATSVQDIFVDGDVQLIPTQWVVMELKFERLAPAWMVAVRRSLGLHSVPVSKFGLSVAKTLRAGQSLELRMLTPPQLRPFGASS